MIKIKKRTQGHRCTKGLTFTLYFTPLWDLQCLPTFKQIASMERRGGFGLQVVEALVNEQESCHTGAVLLGLSERINLCLSLNLYSPGFHGFPSAFEQWQQETPPLWAFTHSPNTSGIIFSIIKYRFLISKAIKYVVVT